MANIFKNTKYLDPAYDILDVFRVASFKLLWTPAKYEQNIENDAIEFKTSLDEVSKNCVRKCILAISVVEDKVKSFWGDIDKIFPQTIISDLAGLLGFQEVVHRISYHSLAESIGVNRDDANNHEALKNRVKYLSKHLEKDANITGNVEKLKKVILFTALVEGISLPTQFYILMSFSKRVSKLRAINQLQIVTATEESFHYDFGRALIKIIKEESPALWSDYLLEFVNKNIKMAYEAELKIIDWIFEGGVPSHITKEEVVNILNYNFQKVSRDLGLGLEFNYDKGLFEEKNEWFFVSTKSPITTDFFAGTVGGYSGEKKEIDISNFNF
jgi:ribonucleoside-diphosphate reductase beta chain